MLNGLYRGVVRNNLDPLKLGRLQVSVPDVHVDQMLWAMPCSPSGGSGDLGEVFIPPTNANVWIMFERGDAVSPVWMGTFWSHGGPPPEASELHRRLRTHGITVDLIDEPGSPRLDITLATGQFISVGRAGITISNGQGASIVLEGPTVRLNNGALDVT